MTKEPDESPGRVPGKWVLLAILLLGLATVAVGVVAVRPVPGYKPPADEARAYGPAGAADQRDIPMIQRKAAAEPADGN